MTAPRDVYTVAYYPIANAGSAAMWQSYNGAQYQSDMELIKAQGFNTIRVFVSPTTGAFDFPTPTSGELANLADFYDRAEQVGLQLHLGLFDQWNLSGGGAQFGHIADSKTWVSAIIGELPASVQCLELKNEVQFSSTGTYAGGFDSGWSGTQYTQTGQVAIVWAQAMVPYIKGLTKGGLPITVSFGHTTMLADIQAILTPFVGSTPAFDWYEPHCYPGDPRSMYQFLQAAVAAVGDPSKILVGEGGQQSATNFAIGQLPQNPQFQADFYQHMRWCCAQLGLGEPAPWQQFDLPVSSQFPSGQTFGQFDTSGKIKPLGQMYRAFSPGRIVPAVPLAFDEPGIYVDPNGNTLPLRCFLTHGQTGTQPITASVTSYAGEECVLLSGSGASVNTDTPPALETDPLGSPPVAGQTYTFGIELAGAGAYGFPSLQVAWYDVNNNFLSPATVGEDVTLTPELTEYSLASTAPANAGFARLQVRTPQNAGSIWATGVTWG